MRPSTRSPAPPSFGCVPYLLSISSLITTSTQQWLSAPPFQASPGRRLLPLPPRYVERLSTHLSCGRQTAGTTSDGRGKEDVSNDARWNYLLGGRLFICPRMMKRFSWELNTLTIGAHTAGNALMKHIPYYCKRKVEEMQCLLTSNPLFSL